MNLSEMSVAFDVAYNNINSNQAMGLNEYEKSVFLTKAQDEIVKNYFNANSSGNIVKEGFDDNQKRQIDFSMLMRSYQSGPTAITGGIKFDPRSNTYKLPSDIFLVINESLLLQSGGVTKGIRQIIPLQYSEYTRLMSKPFKEPVRYQAWRLLTNADNGTGVAEIITTTEDKSQGYTEVYDLRYIKRPNPIILVDLTNTFGEDLYIHEQQAASPCELDPIIHEEIVQRAVELAVASYTDVNTQNALQSHLAVGQRAE